MEGIKEKIKTIWSGLSWPLRIVFFVLAPLGLMMILMGKGSSWLSLILDSIKRMIVDRKAAKLQEQEDAAKKAADIASNNVSNLEKAKEDAIKSTDNDDPTKFHNGR